MSNYFPVVVVKMNRKLWFKEDTRTMHDWFNRGFSVGDADQSEIEGNRTTKDVLVLSHLHGI